MKMVYDLIYNFVSYLGVRYPKTLVNVRYYLRFGKFPNFKSPTDLNEKILYLKLFSDTSIWTVLADKYRVREYVQKKGFSDILVPIFGVYNCFDEIDFSLLPEKYVLKSNNGAGDGSVVLVRDKENADLSGLKSKTEIWLRKIPGATSAEIHYYSIKPLIISEQLLENLDGSSIIDYKIWCFDGNPFVVLTCSDRMPHSLALRLYDLSWNEISENLVYSKEYVKGKEISKPQNLEYMIQIAKSLSESFYQVRIDLYEINAKVYFGEMSFTSLGGMMNYFTPEFLKEMGAQFDISEIRK